MEIRAMAAPWKRGIEILVKDGEYIGKYITVELPEDGMVINPTMEISYKDAQTLMDDLWYAGLRPTEGTGSAGSLSATQAHLKDMQKIAFNVLNIKEK